MLEIDGIAKSEKQIGAGEEAYIRDHVLIALFPENLLVRVSLLCKSNESQLVS